MELKQKFLEYTKNWQENLNQDEWYFSRFREDTIESLKLEEAFRLIPESVDLILIQDNEYLVSETLDLLIGLIRASNTTEMPQELQDKWQELILYLASFEDIFKERVGELKRLYRKIEQE